MNFKSLTRPLMAGVTAAVLAAVALTWVQTRQAVATTSDADGKALFVQSVASGTFDGQMLKLMSASGLTLWFSDRPEHRAGYVSDAEFGRAWSTNADSFATDPPDAVLYVAGGASEAILELGGLEVTAGGLVYKVSSVKGAVPAAFGGAALFIDDGRIPD